MAFRRLFGSDHGVVDAAGEQLAVVGDAVVVLAGGHVPGAAGEVEVRHPGLRGPPVPRLPHELRVHHAGAVHAGGVHGVVVRGGQRLILVPESDRLQHRVDQPFGCGAHHRVARPGQAHGPHGAVLSDQAPVGGDAVHPRLAGGEVGAGPRLGHRRRGCAGGCRARPLRPVAGHDHVRPAVRIQDVLRVAVRPRRVVRMGAVHGHAIGFGAHRLGQIRPPAVVVAVAELGPVERAEHDRRPVVSDENQPEGLQPFPDRLRRRIPARAQRMADRRRDVGRERAQPDHPHTSRSTRR